MPKKSDPDDKDGKEQYETYKNIYLIGTVGIQIVVSILIGFGIGLALDRWLGTAPWLMLLFIIFGVAAGFLNVYREATKNGFD
ncbi:ATP synthase protein I [hydrothermal vent metagenome]|uniref:ATP synthase protein I n=1 Tax=hydrothermal vent metagenome TaxID=652676 RepID=A0A3B1CT55_9ZZZZ